MNFEVISGFIDQYDLWDRTFKEFTADDIRRLAEAFIEAACYPGDQVQRPQQAKCLSGPCQYCLMKPDPVVKSVLFCGYDGQPVFDLYYQDGCPLGHWKTEKDKDKCLTSTIKPPARR